MSDDTKPTTEATYPFALPGADPMPTGMSREIDRIAGAVSVAQGQMFSPARNRHVNFITRRGDTVDYRYTTLDAINDMIRAPLADNGLALMHFTTVTGRGTFLRTRLLLEGTSQWLETTLPITVVGEGPQALMSAMTYARRYAVCMLLNIAAEEDDDGNAAQGNAGPDFTTAKRPGDRERLIREQYNRLMFLGNTAAHPGEITEMLQIWQRDCETFLSYREDSARHEQWEVIFRLVPGAIARVFGAKLGDVWRRATTATTVEDVDCLRVLWTDAAFGRAEMKAVAVVGYGLLSEYVRMTALRVVRLIDDEGLTRQVEASPATTFEQGFNVVGDERLYGTPDLSTAETVTINGVIVMPNDRVEPVFVEPVFVEPVFVQRPLYTPFDEHGEVAGDAAKDAVAFAQMFVKLVDVSDDFAALVEHNARSLDAAAGFAVASGIIFVSLKPSMLTVMRNGLAAFSGDEERPGAFKAPPSVIDPVVAVAAASVPPAEDKQAPLFPKADASQQRVPMPVNGGGQPYLAGYMLLVKQALQHVGSDAFASWLAANDPTVQSLPGGTKLQVLALIETRRRVLGLDA